MIYHFDRFELDEERRELRDRGEPVGLQPLAFDTLAILVRNHDRVVQKQELLDAIWPDGFVAEGSLQRAVSLVRSALGDDRHEVIRTFPGRGYRFSATVDEISPLTDGKAPAHGRSEPEPQKQPVANLSERRRSITEPRIQYATTSDGVHIAYWTLGEGPALVSMGDAPSSHIRLEWDIPELRSWYQALASEHTLVRFDPRGGGLSDREVPEFSLEAFGRDLESVVDRLGLQTFALYAYHDSGPVAIAYAARNPDRVSHLILWCTYAKAVEYRELPQITAVRPLMDVDYELFMRTLAHLCLGWASGEPVRRWAQLMQEGWSRDTLEKIYPVVQTYDVTDDLPRVSAPTLVMHARGVDWLPDDASRRIASGIPNARLAIVDGVFLPWVRDSGPILDMIAAFLNGTH